MEKRYVQGHLNGYLTEIQINLYDYLLEIAQRRETLSNIDQSCSNSSESHRHAITRYIYLKYFQRIRRSQSTTVVSDIIKEMITHVSFIRHETNQFSSIEDEN